MSYTDKCCGVCDQYVDVTETGKLLYLEGLDPWPETKRFRYGVNVCDNCTNNKQLKCVSVIDLNLHKTFKESKNITKGYTMLYDPSNMEMWKCPNNRLDKDEQHLCDKRLLFSKKCPRLLEVTGKGVEHTGLFSYGGIYSYDKRKLRKVLRKLGVVGKVELLVK